MSKPIEGREGLLVTPVVPHDARAVRAKDKAPTSTLPPAPTTKGNTKPASVGETSAAEAARRAQSAVTSIEARVRAVLDAHADTLSVAEGAAHLTAAEAASVRDAMWDLQQELAKALTGLVPDAALQKEQTTLLAQVREASPHGDKRQTLAPRVSLQRLGALQDAVGRYVAAAEKLAALPAARASFATLLERAGVFPRQSFERVDPAMARELVNELLATPTTLVNEAARIGLLRLLTRVLEDGEPADLASLDAQVQTLSHAALLRSDGYFVSLATAEPMAFAGKPLLHPNRDCLMSANRFVVGEVYTLSSGSVRDEQTQAHVGYFDPLDSRLMIRAIAGVGRAIDETVRGIPHLFMHPVDTLGPILPSLAQAFAHAPEQLELFRALPAGDKAEALGHFAAQMALLVLGARGGGASRTSTLLTGVRFTESGTLALSTAQATVAIDAHEAALGLLTSHMAARNTPPAALRDRPPQPTDIRMQHILEGEVKVGWDKQTRRYVKRGTGFHVESATDKARMIEGTRRPTDLHGVYEGRVEIFDAESGTWIQKKNRSSFFPRDYTAADVEAAIREAYANATELRAGTWVGQSAKGIRIRMFIDEASVIESAFPEYLR